MPMGTTRGGTMVNWEAEENVDKSSLRFQNVKVSEI